MQNVSMNIENESDPKMNSASGLDKHKPHNDSHNRICRFRRDSGGGLSSLWLVTLLMFILALVLNQLDEVLDLPHVIFGAPATPINYMEMFIEGISIIVIAAISVVGIRYLSERHVRHESKIAHLNILMAAIGRVGRLIGKEKNIDRLTVGICEALVDEGSYNMAWIALMDEDHKVVSMAQSGMHDRLPYAKNEDKTLAVPACVEMIVGSEDVQVVDRSVKGCSNCELHNYNPGHSALLVALRHQDRIYGVLGVSSQCRFAVEKEEQELLKEVSHDISLALWGLETGTQQAAAELALQESEDRYRIVFESSPHGIIVADAESREIRYANPAMCRMLDYTESELLSLHIDDLHPSECIEGVMREYESQLKGEKTHSLDIICKGKNNKRSHVILNCEHVIMEGRRNIVCFFNDVSSRRQLEEQLNQSLKLEAIGRLAGGVAHDFNNLLSVIITFSGFALESLRENDPLYNDILEIRKAGERAAVLTRQLLAFSRKQVLQPQVLDPKSLITGMEGMLRRLIGEDIELFCQLPEKLGRIKADPGQIEQIIMNLAVNSRDAMPGGGKLTIEAADVELDEEYTSQHVSVLPGPYVMISVTDTGCGMDEETARHIFEPFFTTKEAGKGTGLGMSTVYGFVKQSGGSIWVYSEVGRGTTIKIFLPRILSVPEQPAAARKRVPLRIAGERTVLVVEDDNSVRSLVRRVLETSGFTVISASSGVEALALCDRQQHKIDLLLTDVIMPQMSGRDLAGHIRERYPDMQVLFMSGYTSNAIANNGVLEPGMNFIGKPFTAADLSEKIQEILGAVQHGPESGITLPPPDAKTGKNFVSS